MNKVASSTPPSEFFSILGRLAGRQREDQLSNTFRACFNASGSFREAVLRLLLRRCGLPFRKAGTGGWTCRTQVAKWRGDVNARHDIVITKAVESSTVRRDPTRIVLESKVTAVLTKNQLRKYKDLGEKHLLAITREYPDVSRAWMASQKIGFLRWQDIYRSMEQARVKGSLDRFIVEQFMEYLEALAMAHHDVHISDLEGVGELFRRVTGDTEDGIVRTALFGVVDDCLNLLKDLSWDLQDSLPQAKALNWWGPGYANDSEGIEEKGRCHYLMFAFQRGEEPKIWVECGFEFHEASGRVKWKVYAWDYEKDESVEKPLIKSLAAVADKSKRLDRDKLFDSALSCAKNWGFG